VAWAWVVLVFRSSSHWLVLIVLYITALLHADLLHAGYIALFTVMSINPRLCKKYWFLLPWYSSLVSVVVLVWGVLGTHYDRTHAVPDWLFGEHVESVRTNKWLRLYVCNLVLTCLAALQVGYSGMWARAVRGQRVYVCVGQGMGVGEW
jgi:hypothetical protein